MDSCLTGRLSVGLSILPANSLTLSHRTLASPPSSGALDTHHDTHNYLTYKVDIKIHCCPDEMIQWVKALAIKSGFDPQDPQLSEVVPGFHI